MSKKTDKKKVSKSKKKFSLNKISLKLFLIFIFLFGFYYTQSSYNNTITLLAVNQDENGNVAEGSTVNLSLTVKPGNGNIFVNLNSIKEIDTQVSIINSQKVACNLFSIDCSKHDFYYDFQGSAIILKGPSASSAIAILVAKTLNKEKINSQTTITGSLNSGGLIGNVGGVDEKILVAQDRGFKKVIIPTFSNYNLTNDKLDIEVIKVIDIIDAYNQFNGEKYSLNVEKPDKENYEILMRDLGELLCDRSRNLQKEFDKNITNESKIYQYKKQAEESFNSSKIAKEHESYYSQGSFCFNSNINSRILIEKSLNQSKKELLEKVNTLEKKVILKYNQITNKNYKDNIKTINDFYVYLIMLDRIDEANEYLRDIKKNNEEKTFTLLTEINNSNQSVSNISENKTVNDFDINENVNLYAYANERFYTVFLWEKFMDSSGSKIKFNDFTISDSCSRINREISIKSELISSYGITFFNEILNEQLQFNNKVKNQYLCIYKGLETLGRINTVLNSAGVANENDEEFFGKIINFTDSRINLNSEGEFPLIPYIYNEYSKELFAQEDYSSAFLYSNFALAYTDINIYLEKEDNKKGFFNVFLNELYGNYLFLGAVLFLIGFV